MFQTDVARAPEVCSAAPRIMSGPEHTPRSSQPARSPFGISWSSIQRNKGLGLRAGWVRRETLIVDIDVSLHFDRTDLRFSKAPIRRGHRRSSSTWWYSLYIFRHTGIRYPSRNKPPKRATRVAMPLHVGLFLARHEHPTRPSTTTCVASVPIHSDF